MSKKDKKISENIDKENQNFMDNLKGNDQLKKVLFKAKNITENLTNKVVPAMAKSIHNLMIEINANKTSLKDWNTMKFLRGHCYFLASYDRKKDLNQNFEVSITMAVRLAIMKYDNNHQFDITENNEILVMSKIATPFNEVRQKGQKGNVKKVKNDSEELVEIVPSHINKIWSVKYPTTSRSSQTKDTKINFSQMSVNFEKELEKIYNIANKKDNTKLLDLIDNKAIESLGNIKALLEDNSIRQAFINANENLSVNGDVKKIA